MWLILMGLAAEIAKANNANRQEIFGGVAVRGQGF